MQAIGLQRVHNTYGKYEIKASNGTNITIELHEPVKLADNAAILTCAVGGRCGIFCRCR